MRGRARFRFMAALLLSSSFMASTASAQGRTAFLIERLRADDFKVRTNAALALGATDDDAAIQPLCGALSDPTEVVRQASAAALKRLGRASAVGCLRSRLGVETREPVKLQISRALESIEAVAGGGEGSSSHASELAPKFVPNAKFYIAVSVVNNTSRPKEEVEGVVLNAVRHKFEQFSDFQLAPTKETVEAARTVMTKRRLKGFYLTVSVERFDYSGGNLTVRVKMPFFTYPGRALQGEAPARFSQSGVGPGDKSAEDTLIGMGTARVVELFARNVE